jgi:hypothetical protein
MPKVGDVRHAGEPVTAGHVLVTRIINNADQKRGAFLRLTWACDAIKRNLTELHERVARLQADVHIDREDLGDRARDIEEAIVWAVPNMHTARLQQYAHRVEMYGILEQQARAVFTTYDGPDKTAAQARLDAFDAQPQEAS